MKHKEPLAYLIIKQLLYFLLTRYSAIFLYLHSCNTIQYNEMCCKRFLLIPVECEAGWAGRHFPAVSCAACQAWRPGTATGPDTEFDVGITGHL